MLGPLHNWIQKKGVSICNMFDRDMVAPGSRPPFIIALRPWDVRDRGGRRGTALAPPRSVRAAPLLEEGLAQGWTGSLHRGQGLRQAS